MNLFINPSLNELHNLINECDNSSPHQIVVDYDGEVIVDPQLKLPDVDPGKFKFNILLRIPGKSYLSRGTLWMKSLLNNLVYCWENNVKGSIALQ